MSVHGFGRKPMESYKIEPAICKNMGKRSIHKQEDELFSEWSEYKDENFCQDGLHYTGRESNDSGYWNMLRDDKEESRWWASNIRCLFLTKDYNDQGDGFGVDTRYETGLNNITDGVYYQFFSRYLQLLYGIMHINPSTFEYPDLDEVKNPDTYLDYFHEAPVVRINTKKMSGGSVCKWSDLAAYLQKDNERIKRQMGIYDANIVVVCQGSDWNIDEDHTAPYHILDVVYQKYPDMKIWEKGDGWIYYSEQAKVVIVHEYHMSCFSVSYAEYYKATGYVAEFLKEHPEYLRTSGEQVFVE